MSSKPNSQLAILLCTFQGQRFLAEQLDSFEAQTFEDWTLWASDDGSMDETLSILESYRAVWPDGRLRLLGGPQRGFAANFLSLMCHADVDAEFYAWSDQDDVWEANKLKRVTDWLAQQPADVPALYCSRTRLVDAENRHLGYSPLFNQAPSFANALVQNVAGGNTMALNRAARALIQAAGEHTEAVSHDWWAYQLVSACGGTVFYDPYPAVRYRQHGANLVGANADWRARLSRLDQLLRGRFRQWNDANLTALSRMQTRFTAENQKTLAYFSEARSQWLLPRITGLWRSGVYRQTFPGTLALFVGAVLGRI